ncbi:MAG: N-acetyltransferase [Muribaculaceae bacterium]|nr:N-acetyltransferase [Muribaculaceae bacterium]
MPLKVVPVPATKKELQKFIKFGIDLYKGNDCYVPPLILDEINTLRPDKNPAFDFCDCQAFMAYQDGKPVGRIAGIINHEVNRRTSRRTLRFGFCDFIDSNDVVDALFAAVKKWGAERGMDEIVGPMGFTDLDYEGMLIEGFNELGTMSTLYNYPYYPAQMERMGFRKETDWVEYRMTVPDAVPEKHMRIAEIVRKKYNLRVIDEIPSRKWLKDKYGRQIFELINQAYDGLYGYSPLTPRQIDYYIGMYLGVLRLDCISLIVDSTDTLVGVGISIPSLSRALQNCGGRLFPFGWAGIYKALTLKNDIVDLLLVAVKPEYLSKGVNALLFAQLIPVYIKHGFKWAESNPELDDNANVQNQWQYFERRQHRRRRAYRAPL